MVNLLAARSVYNDCEIALQMLEDETDLRRWRVLWAGAVALARTVGHVLRYVDRPKLKLAAPFIDKRFADWKVGEDHEIFRKFIESERNNILKEYRFNYHAADEVEVLVCRQAISPATGEMIEIHQLIPIGDNIYRPIIEGFREGDDARDVYADALKWWDQELSEIERFGV